MTCFVPFNTVSTGVTPLLHHNSQRLSSVNTYASTSDRTLINLISCCASTYCSQAETEMGRLGTESHAVLRKQMRPFVTVGGLAHIQGQAGVTDFISKYEEDCVLKKTIHVLPNRKPWLNHAVHSQVKPKSALFKSNDSKLYNKYI